jgi:hypothetical protein
MSRWIDGSILVQSSAEKLCVCSLGVATFRSVWFICRVREQLADFLCRDQFESNIETRACLLCRSLYTSLHEQGLQLGKAVPSFALGIESLEVPSEASFVRFSSRREEVSDRNSREEVIVGALKDRFGGEVEGGRILMQIQEAHTQTVAGVDKSFVILEALLGEAALVRFERPCDAHVPPTARVQRRAVEEQVVLPAVTRTLQEVAGGDVTILALADSLKRAVRCCSDGEEISEVGLKTFGKTIEYLIDFFQETGVSGGNPRFTPRTVQPMCDPPSSSLEVSPRLSHPRQPIRHR